jgi:serine/threonine-protein kinase
MPQRIGEYILDTRVGGGSFGQVWLAHHHVWSDQLAAVKLPTDPQYVRQLQREGVTLHALPHPNIVQPIGFDPYADPPYLIMEYVPGSSLRLLIEQRALSITDAQAVLRPILAALAFAHAQGVIHRDIKPENILIHEQAAQNGYDAPGMVKVTDFGLGRAAETVAAGSILHSVSLDAPRSIQLAGTLDYMAPEARRDPASADRRVDLYACGVLLFEMLTGERPAGTETPGELNPAVPKILDAVFKKAYARLDTRFASADDFLAALTTSDPKIQRVAKPPPLPRRPGLCPDCRAQTAPDDQFCLHCGRQLVENLFRCPKCGAYPDPHDAYCVLCGATLNAPARMENG